MSEIVRRWKREVQDYHIAHADLHEAHHYDFAIEHDSRIEYFFFGINPGETPEDRRLFPGVGHFNPFDPVENPPENKKWSQSAKRYRTYAAQICGSYRFLISEFFFWSSRDENELESRYGKRAGSPHWKFCFTQNKKLFQYYNPKAVIVVGLGMKDSILDIHDDLRPVLRNQQSGRRLFEHYTDGERPWFFVIHPNARVSKEQRKLIAALIPH